MRPRDDKQHAQDHTASKQQSWRTALVCLTLKHMLTSDYSPVSINGCIASQAEIPNSATLVPSTLFPPIQCPRPAGSSPTIVLSSSLSFPTRMSLPHSAFVSLAYLPVQYTCNSIFPLNLLPIPLEGREMLLGSCLSRYPGK